MQLTSEVKRLQARVYELERLDAEAAEHVEAVIVQRSAHFTGEPPYVGWKGLGLALRRDYDELDRLRHQWRIAERRRRNRRSFWLFAALTSAFVIGVAVIIAKLLAH